jgi:N6-L-threonylcarbamoyladenine synthase
VCGGVAANANIRSRLTAIAADEAGVEAVFPPAKYCTDNGAMIAWAGVERLTAGFAPLEGEDEIAALDFRNRWPLGPMVEFEEEAFGAQ